MTDWAEIRMQWGGPDEWLAAVRRAGLVAKYSRGYGQGLYEDQGVTLLALVLYVLGAEAGGVDRVDLGAVRAVVTAADDRTPEQLQQVHARLAAGLRQAGHDPDTPASSGPRVNGEPGARIDPVVGCWQTMRLEPAPSTADLVEVPDWFDDPDRAAYKPCVAVIFAVDRTDAAGEIERVGEAFSRMLDDRLLDAACLLSVDRSKRVVTEPFENQNFDSFVGAILQYIDDVTGQRGHGATGAASLGRALAHSSSAVNTLT